MKRGCAAVLAGLAICSAGTVFAKPGTPGPHYFAGTYERIGRAGGEAPRAMNDRVVIVPVDQSVAIRECAGPETLMGFGPAFEIVNLMTGNVGTVSVECLFHNNGYNRPILTCRAADGAAYTLWPVLGVAEDAPLACSG